MQFQEDLFNKAKENVKTIVLPEGDDLRVLQAANYVLKEGIADIIILGNSDDIASKTNELKIDLSKAKIINPKNYEHRQKFVNDYYELRKQKGITQEIAEERMDDVSYFGTMMIYEKLADGMVSGACHTTAHTIKPSFEIIKTVPGVSVVSGAFIMVLSDDVYVYADCAVNPKPTSEQLAQIALSSAKTAVAFGVDPKVAMLSYSTGSSGIGGGKTDTSDIEKVMDATNIAKELFSNEFLGKDEYQIDGPLQYDAAVNKEIAKSKMPDSKVAGGAKVFVFPDLNAGNIGYKAVQQASKALAIGPILQGLKKPVNDLSRGATVMDIVNTIAITAVQASKN